MCVCRVQEQKSTQQNHFEIYKVVNDPQLNVMNFQIFLEGLCRELSLVACSANLLRSAWPPGTSGRPGSPGSPVGSIHFP